MSRFTAHKRTVEGNDELMSFFNPNNARDDVRTKFEEEVDSDPPNIIKTKLELHNRPSEESTNTDLKQL